LIDVNIHPTKMDIKFSKMEELLILVEKLIKDKLKRQILIPEVETIVYNDFEDIKEEIKDERKTEIVEEVKKEKPKYEELTLDLNRVSEDTTTYIKEEKVEEKRLPEIYPVGLVHGTYIICQNEEGMYLIDQHAAKERINYELFKEKLNNPTKESIAMLLPETIEFTNNEYIILKENFEFLNNMGFVIEEFGINSIVIKSHPIWLTKGFEIEQIKRIIELVINKEKDFDLTKFNDHLSATLACKASIKANTDISLNEMECLINDLRKCSNPFNCPHGRPTIIYYSKYDLEKLFKRSGFDNLK